MSDVGVRIPAADSPARRGPVAQNSSATASSTSGNSNNCKRPSIPTSCLSPYAPSLGPRWTSTTWACTLTISLETMRAYYAELKRDADDLDASANAPRVFGGTMDDFERFLAAAK